MTDDIFGFPSARKSTADKINKISPGGGAPKHQADSLEKADAAGAALGFVPRETAHHSVLRRRREIGPTVAINMRVPETVAARFIDFCQQNRLSYWEGVEDLMKRCNLI